MLLKGKVKTGLGEASFWIKKAEDALEKKTNLKLYHGTLNVELDSEYIMDKNLKVLNKEEYGGMQDVYMKECKLFGHKSYILRTEKNMSDLRDHPLNILEIVSDVCFREKYNLKDGDLIEIEIG